MLAIWWLGCGGNTEGCPPAPPGAGACSDDQRGLACGYERLDCSCGSPCSGVPIDPEHPPPDVWTCSGLDPECPSFRPPSWWPCSTPGKTCVYGICGGPTYECVDGWWVEGELIMPP